MAKGGFGTRLKSFKEKLWARIRTTETCWVWQGSINVNGYGRIWKDGLGTTVYAHRAVYEMLVGPIPEGLTLDHLCKNKKCVRPHHLEAVPIGVNILRSDSPAALNARKTHCKKGHPLSGDNLAIYRNGTKRQCRICWNAYWRNYKRKK